MTLDTTIHNRLGQPIGAPVPNWTARPRPSREPIQGRYCRIEALNIACHTNDLFTAFSLDTSGHNWTYLSSEPWQTKEAMLGWMHTTCLSDDPLFHTIIDAQTNRAVGIAALMRIDPTNGVIEVGHIHFSPLLQKQRAGTEAIYLLMARVFDELGYRRFEWKCDALNAPSRAAAQRFGFQFEGIFRQAIVYKNRNRDTAWFAILDRDWPALKIAYERWLDPSNFDGEGRQHQSLKLAGG